MEAVNDLRTTGGRSPDPAALFTALGGEERADEMRFTADLLMPLDVRDQFNVEATATTAAVQYEVAFRLDDRERGGRLELTHESLTPRAAKDVRSTLSMPYSPAFLKSVLKGQSKKRTPFIETDDRPGGAVILAAQDQHPGRPAPLPAARSTRTVLAGLASGEFPTILAAHREFESWRTLMLEPSAMRCPSGYRDESALDDRGGNLPAAVARLEREEETPGETTAELVNRLAELIDDVHALRVRDDPQIETYTVEAGDAADIFYPARALSDGTLRFLVLAVIEQDPTMRGLLCFEEPENGIHPRRIPAMVALLRDIAVDAEESIGPDNPLRQVVVNTHSPPLFGAVGPADIVYFQSVRHGRSRVLLTEPAAPPGQWRTRRRHDGRPATPTLAPGMVRPYFGELEYRERQGILFGEPDIDGHAEDGR